MPIDDHSPWYDACAVLQSKGIPCCAWFDHAIAHHSWKSWALTEIHILVPDIDAAAEVLVQHGWTSLASNTPEGKWRIINTDVTAPQHRLALRPDSKVPYREVVLLPDTQWLYDVTRHHELYPSNDPEWIFPPLAPIIDSFLTILLNSDTTGIEAEPFHWGSLAAMYLESVYETSKRARQDPEFPKRVRDPKLLDELKFENRQFHIDACYGLPVWSDEYMKRAHRVHHELRDGKRGLRDAVAEYDEWVAEMGLDVEEKESS